MSAAYTSLQAKGVEWMKRFHAAGDALNGKPWIDTFWTPDCVLQFSNAPEVSGRDELVTMFTSQFAYLESMKHTILTLGAPAPLFWLTVLQTSSATRSTCGQASHTA